MGLFKEQIEGLLNYLEKRQSHGSLKEYQSSSSSLWQEHSSLVLKEDTAIELGGFGNSSLFLLLWTEQAKVLHPNRISLIGPDLAKTGQTNLPFAQIVLVKGDFQDQYESYQDLRDVIFDIRLSGISTRIWPDKHQIWCRVSKEAMDNGFNLIRYGEVLSSKLNSLEMVHEVELIFVTSRQEIDFLRPIAEKTQDIVEALIKMYQEMNFDCETCEYNQICDEVEELTKIRERLKEKRI